MPHLISNLVEKNFTPYTARLAPKNLWSRPALGKYIVTLLEWYLSTQRTGVRSSLNELAIPLNYN